jgi:YjbE family integral membrane protein
VDLSAQVSTILEVIFINVVLSGDNAVVVGMAAAGAPAAIRPRVILYGIGGAVVLRVILSLLAVKFLNIVGLLFVGGILLLWVCWKLYREIRAAAAEHAGVETLSEVDDPETLVEATKTMGEALWQIIVADISMSLDNVLAVAGAAREHPWIMACGLLLSIALMGLAATLIARLLDRHHWLAWVGLIVIAYVALSMIWEGGWEIGETIT